jgi:hypothetical protein
MIAFRDFRNYLNIERAREREREREREGRELAPPSHVLDL